MTMVFLMVRVVSVQLVAGTGFGNTGTVVGIGRVVYLPDDTIPSAYRRPYLHRQQKSKTKKERIGCWAIATYVVVVLVGTLRKQRQQPLATE